MKNILKPTKSLLAVASSLAILGCSPAGSPDSLRDRATTGVAFAIQINLHKDQSQADMAASVFEDNVRQPLVGGDLFLAKSPQQSDGVVLKSIENLGGAYQGKLSVSATDTVTVASAYDPQLARQDRWYPTDQLLIDPGPNKKLVGFSFDAKFPQRLEALALGSDVFTSRSDDIAITWKAGDGKQMNSNAVVTCYGGDGNTHSFPRQVILGDDDGSETIKVNSIIPNEVIINAVASFTQEVVTIISAAILDAYTFGLVNAKNIDIPAFKLTHCDVDLTVFREKDDSQVEGSDVIISTSDSVRFTYQPAQ